MGEVHQRCLHLSLVNCLVAPGGRATSLLRPVISEMVFHCSMKRSVENNEPFLSGTMVEHKVNYREFFLKKNLGESNQLTDPGELLLQNNNFRL